MKTIKRMAALRIRLFPRRCDHSIASPSAMSLATSNINSQSATVLSDEGAIYLSSLQLYLKALGRNSKTKCGNLGTPKIYVRSSAICLTFSPAHLNVLVYSATAQFIHDTYF